MPWNEATSRTYSRAGSGYPGFLTDEEWSLIEPGLQKRSKRGCPRTTDMRVAADALPCVAESGRQWRPLPKSFPFFTTVEQHFYLWRDSGVYAEILAALAGREREWWCLSLMNETAAKQLRRTHAKRIQPGAEPAPGQILHRIS